MRKPAMAESVAETRAATRPQPRPKIAPATSGKIQAGTKSRLPATAMAQKSSIPAARFMCSIASSSASIQSIIGSRSRLTASPRGCAAAVLRAHPLSPLVIEGLGRRRDKILVLQDVLIDFDVPRRNAQQIKGVGLVPRATRSGRAGLDDERGQAGNIVALPGVADVARVEVAGEQNVGAAIGEALQCHPSAADDLPVRAAGLRDIERVMRHDDLGKRWVEAAD